VLKCDFFSKLFLQPANKLKSLDLIDNFSQVKIYYSAVVAIGKFKPLVKWYIDRVSFSQDYVIKSTAMLFFKWSKIIFFNFAIGINIDFAQAKSYMNHECTRIISLQEMPL